jgi:hypothetical protein
MRAFREVAAEELLWVRPKRLRLQFELRAGEDVVATLAWTRGSNALGEWAGGQYHFRRAGWLRPRIVVSDAAGGGQSAAGSPTEPLATFTYRGGMLTFPDGRAFTWTKPKRWTTERIWVDGAATVLVHCRPARWRTPGAVTIQPEAAARRELPLLVLLGQYLLVQAAQESAASSAATVPIISSS